MLLAKRCVHPMASSRLLVGLGIRSYSLVSALPKSNTQLPIQQIQTRQFSKILPSTYYSDDNIKIITKEWVNKWVIKQKLCPFAGAVVKADKVRMVVNRETVPNPDDDEALAAFLGGIISEAVSLGGKDVGMEVADDRRHNADTTMIIMPKMKEYGDFKQLVDALNAYLEKMQLSNVIQLSFYHPLYKIKPRFQDGELLDQPVDMYSKRSPYPVIHLLKLRQVHQTMMAYTLKHNPPGTGGRGRVKNRDRQTMEKIDETVGMILRRNVMHLRELGLGQVRTLLRDLYTDAPLVKDDGSGRSGGKNEK